MLLAALKHWFYCFTVLPDGQFRRILTAGVPLFLKWSRETTIITGFTGSYWSIKSLTVPAHGLLSTKDPNNRTVSLGGLKRWY